MGVGGQCHTPAALPPGKTWYPMCRRLGGPQGQSLWVWKISPPMGFDTRTIQHVAYHYTNCTNPATIYLVINKLKHFTVPILYRPKTLPSLYSEHKKNTLNDGNVCTCTHIAAFPSSLPLSTIRN